MKKKPAAPVGRRCPKPPSVKPGAPVAAPVAERAADVPVAAPVAPVTAPLAPEYVGTAHAPSRRKRSDEVLGTPRKEPDKESEGGEE